MKSALRLLVTSMCVVLGVGCATTVTRDVDAVKQETMRARVDCPASVQDIDGNT